MRYIGRLLLFIDAMEAHEMSNPYRIRKPIGRNYNVDPEDVWVVKKNLLRRGFYNLEESAINEYPDKDLFSAIANYQSRNGLKIDGILIPGGETELHILSNGESENTYRCTVCGAPHGGVYSSAICWQCWSKGFR